MKILKRAHPFLFLVSSLISMFVIASNNVSPGQVVRPFVFLSVLILLLIYPTYWLARDWDLATILLSVFVAAFCSSPIYFYFICLVVVAGFVFVFAQAFLRKYKITLERFSIMFGVVGLALVSLSILVVLFYNGNSLWAYKTKVYDRKKTVVTLPPNSAVKPDIYYIILDAYGRRDILADYYQFDNTPFLNELERKGFFVVEDARSNYPKTVLSVTSTLNMNYIDALTPGLGDTQGWWMMSPLIDHSSVRAALENIGYQSISVYDDWGITDNPTTDLYLSPSFFELSDFEGFLLGATPLGFLRPFLGYFTILPSFSGHRETIEYNFHALTKISTMPPGPKFVVAHIVAPHPPFVFDEAGNPLDPNVTFNFNDASGFYFSDEVYKKGYIGQVQFVNTRLLQVVDDILKNSKTPPIIILQADHGPGMFLDFESAENSCLKERHSIFAAYYLPNKNKNIIPEGMTPVNLFRMIFNEYFDANLPILERSHYFSLNSTVYSFTDISSIVDTCTGDGK